MTLTEALFWGIAALLTALCVIVLGRPLRPVARLWLAAAVPLAALALYVMLGSPWLTGWRTTAPLPPMVASAVEKLESDTRANPGDAQAWALLAGVYGRISRNRMALEAARHAATLSPDDPLTLQLLGQSLVATAGGRVTPEALALFRRNAGQPPSDYYIALEKSQQADWRGAAAIWSQVAAATPDTSPLHQAALDRRAEAAIALGEDMR